MSALISIFAAILLPPVDGTFGDRRVEVACPLSGFLDRHLFEHDGVAAGHELAHFPRRRVDEGRVADEAAEAESVGDEDDGLIAAYVDGPDRIAIVQDVRWMPAGDAPARARPLPLVRLQAHAHAIGVAVDLPGVAEEELHVRGCQIVGIGLRTAHGLDLPVARVGGTQVRPQSAAEQPVDAVPATERDPVTLLEPAAFEPAEAAHREGRPAPHVLRHIERAAHGHVGPEPRRLNRLHLELVARLHADALPERQRPAVEGRVHVRAGDGQDATGVEAGLEPAHRHLEGRRALGVAHEEVGNAEGEVVHGARRVRAESEVAYPAWEVLYGRLDAAFENLEHHPPPPLWNRYVLDGLCLAPLERRHLVLHRVEEAAVGLHIEHLVLHDLVPIGAVVDTRTNRLQLVVRHAHPLDAIGGLQEDRVRLERGVPLLEVEDRDGAPEELVTARRGNGIDSDARPPIPTAPSGVHGRVGLYFGVTIA